MELKSNRQQKNLIECSDCSVSDSDIEKSQWYFAELCSEYMDIDFFDDEKNTNSFDCKDILSWCINILNESPSARQMLKEASDKDWKVTLDDLCGGDYYIDVEEKLLVLDNNALEPNVYARSNYFKNITIVNMIKALRDIWQEKRHGGFDEIYTPENILLMERIRAADLDVMAVFVAWELRSEDYPDLWRHMIGSEICDMAMAFSGYLERDPSSQFNGQGLVAIFKQWFRSASRVDACDHDALEYMDDVLLISDSSNPFGKKKPSKMNIEILSCLPDKTAYLQGQGSEIMSDPLYSSIDNEINQTHLFHIVHDSKTFVVEGVAFRDAGLAQKIFPQD